MIPLDRLTSTWQERRDAAVAAVATEHPVVLARFDQQQAQLRAALLRDHGLDLTDPATAETVMRLVLFIQSHVLERLDELSPKEYVTSMRMVHHPRIAAAALETEAAHFNITALTARALGGRG